MPIFVCPRNYQLNFLSRRCITHHRGYGLKIILLFRRFCVKRIHGLRGLKASCLGRLLWVSWLLIWHSLICECHWIKHELVLITLWLLLLKRQFFWHVSHDQREMPQWWLQCRRSRSLALHNQPRLGPWFSEQCQCRWRDNDWAKTEEKNWSSLNAPQ